MATDASIVFSDERKRCSKCKQWKPREEFSRDGKRADGLNYWCKECSRAATADAYRKRRDGLRIHPGVGVVIPPPSTFASADEPIPPTSLALPAGTITLRAWLDAPARNRCFLCDSLDVIVMQCADAAGVPSFRVYRPVRGRKSGEASPPLPRDIALWYIGTLDAEALDRGGVVFASA